MKAPAPRSALAVRLPASLNCAQGSELGDETPTCGRFHGFSVLARVMPAFLMALALAGLVHSSPAAPQKAASSPGQATAGAGQQTEPSGAGDLATIIQSGSTNTRAYTVVIHNDGSATAEIGGAGFGLRPEPPRSQQFPPGTIDTKALRRLLTKVGDVSRIPTGNCVKSVSFGTRTQISYAGRSSGDLQCIRPQASASDPALLQASQELSRFVQATLGQLRIHSMRLGSNP